MHLSTLLENNRRWVQETVAREPGYFRDLGVTMDGRPVAAPVAACPLAARAIPALPSHAADASPMARAG